MDQLIRRTRMAERQVARRLKAMNRIRYETRFKQERQRGIGQMTGEAVFQRRAAIKARHEDWEMGPLAPRRDIPAPPPQVGAGRLDIYWGTVSPGRANMARGLTKKELEACTAWAGGLEKLCLAEGDRVVILEGPQRGLITTIDQIDKEYGTVKVKNVAKINITQPEFFRAQAPNPATSVDYSIPIAAIRLVHPLPRPDGQTRDVIIRELRPTEYVYDRVTRKSEFNRVVPGLNIKIPWPVEKDPPLTDYAADMSRIEVELRTFVPTLLRPPMPVSVIDELRNRYSKFRTRHTDEYIAQKEAEQAAKEERKRSPLTMVTPIQEFNRQQRELRRARGQPVLTEEMLEKIGEVILTNKRMRQSKRSVNNMLEKLSIAEDAESPLAQTQAPPS